MHFRCEVETAQTGDKVAWSGSKPLRNLKGLPHDSNGISTMVCLQNEVALARIGCPTSLGTSVCKNRKGRDYLIGPPKDVRAQ
jgi:hypothetical protein